MLLFFILSEENASKATQLFSLYEKPVAYYLFNFLEELHLAEDALQTVFVKLINNIEKISDVKSKETKNYIYKIAKNTAIDVYNKRKAEREFTRVYDETVSNLIDEKRATEVIARQDMNEELEEWLKELREEDREIISLRYGLDWSDGRIAMHYDITEQAVRKRISRARMRLAEVIEANRAKNTEKGV